MQNYAPLNVVPFFGPINAFMVIDICLFFTVHFSLPSQRKLKNLMISE